MISFLWYKAKKAKYYALAVLLAALMLGASPYLLSGVVVILLAADKLIEFLD